MNNNPYVTLPVAHLNQPAMSVTWQFFFKKEDTESILWEASLNQGIVTESANTQGSTWLHMYLLSPVHPGAL